MRTDILRSPTSWHSATTYARTPVEAAAYGELKQRLALAHSDDNIGYMLGKDAFVKSLLAAARLWYVSSEALSSESHRSGSGSSDRDA